MLNGEIRLKPRSVPLAVAADRYRPARQVLAHLRRGIAKALLINSRRLLRYEAQFAATNSRSMAHQQHEHVLTRATAREGVQLQCGIRARLY